MDSIHEKDLQMINYSKYYQSLFIGLLSISFSSIYAATVPASLDSFPAVKKLMANETLNRKSLSADTPIACNQTALVNAINAANIPDPDNSTGQGLITLPANCNIVISASTTLTDGLPNITGNVTIVGAGKTTVISRDPGAPAFRIITVANGGTLKLRNLIMAYGVSSGLGGGVQVEGTLYLKDVNMSHNRASNGGGIAVVAGGTANVIDSLFEYNTTSGVGGGGIINSGTLNIINTNFQHNTAPINGGAINVQGSGVTTVQESTFNFNTSGSLGGAISNLGSIDIFNSAIQFNTGSSGGGIATGNTNVTLRGTIITDNNPTNCSPLNTIEGCVN